MRLSGVGPRLGVLAVINIVSGCASFFNPYVDTTSLTHVADPSNPHVVTYPCSKFPGDMQEAVYCAQAVQSKYVANMAEQSILSSVSGIGLIALTAYTTGVAINDGHTTNVTDLSLGTAGLFGMAQWLSQPERTKIYGLGLNAVQCALTASVPFQAGSFAMGALTTSVTELDKQIVVASNKLETLQALLGTNTKSITASSVEARAKAKAASRLIEQARLSSVAASKLVATYNRAPHELVNAVNGINASVNVGLKNTIQSMSALPGSLTGVMAMYSDLAGGLAAFGYSAPGGSASPDEKILTEAAEKSRSASISGLNPAVLELENALADLAAKKAPVDSAIAVLTPSLEAKSAELCGVDLSSIRQSISVAPATLTFGDSSAATLSAQISGGSGSYVFSHDAASLDIQQIPAFGSSLQIKPVSSASPGTYSVTITDISGNTGALSVTVEGSNPLIDDAPKEPSRDSIGPACKAYNDSADASRLTVEACNKRFEGESIALSGTEKGMCIDGKKTATLQAQLRLRQSSELCADGVYGKQTRAALIEELAKEGVMISATNEITQAHMDKVAKVPPPPAISDDGGDADSSR